MSLWGGVTDLFPAPYYALLLLFVLGLKLHSSLSLQGCGDWDCLIGDMTDSKFKLQTQKAKAPSI